MESYGVDSHQGVIQYTNMPCQCGYPDGMTPRGRMVFPRAAWHICFIIPNKPQFGKISMKTTMTPGRSSEKGGRFASGHFAGGHDGMANLCKPITAYDFHLKNNKAGYIVVNSGECVVFSLQKGNNEELVRQRLALQQRNCCPVYNTTHSGFSFESLGRCFVFI